MHLRIKNSDCLLLPGHARNLLEHDGTGSPGNEDDDPYGVSPRPSSPWEVQTPVPPSFGKQREAIRQDDASFVGSQTADMAKKKSPVLAGDIKLELASGVKDFSANVNRSFTGNAVKDQNFAEKTSEVAADS